MKTALLTAALVSGFSTTTMAQDFKWQAFYTQTYENVAQVGDVWNCPNNQGGLSLKEDGNGNHYVYYIGSGSGDRGMRNLDVLTADAYEGLNEYRLEFDLALGSKSQDNHLTEFHVASPDLSYNSNNINYGIGDGSLFSLFQAASNSTSWRLYCQTSVDNNSWLGSTNYNVTLDSEVFYHFAVTVTPHEATETEGWNANVMVEVYDMDGNPLNIINGDDGSETVSVTLPYTDLGNGFWFQNFYPRPSRNGGVFMIDNIQVMKKVDANSVTPPTLSMTGVQLDGRVIALDNGSEADVLIPYYAIVDESTYNTTESAEELTGIEYTVPFVVSAEMNYILAWNKNEAGKASELTKFTCEAGWTPQLNAPTISAVDYSGYKKTYEATCTQADIKPLAPLSYTIYMSTDSATWIETSTLTVTEGLVYAKVEADGYAPAGNGPVEVPVECYGSTKWNIGGMVITKEAYPNFNFDNCGKGRVHVSSIYWNEELDTYEADNAWEPLKKMGLHFKGADSDMFLLGSGNANGFTVNGLVVYNARGSFSIDNLQAGDIVQIYYDDNSSEVITVEDPESFTIAIPQHGKHASLQSIAIKGLGTVETREAKAGEWGIMASSRTVADVSRAGAKFYEHVYTIYNDQQVADTLLLQEVDALQAGYAYIYKAEADQIELVTLAAEEPMDEQDDAQADAELWTLGAALDSDGYEDEGLYTMQPGGILMNNEKMMTIPMGQGYFTGLAMPENYIEEFDYKLQDEYTSLAEAVQKAVDKAVEDWKNAGAYDEEGNWWPAHDGDMSEEELAALYEKTYNDKYNALLGKFVAIPVLHSFDQNIADVIKKVDTNALVNVVTPSGLVVRRGVKANEALNGLKSGLYIVGSKKIVK